MADKLIKFTPPVSRLKAETEITRAISEAVNELTKIVPEARFLQGPCTQAEAQAPSDGRPTPGLDMLLGRLNRELMKKAA